MPWPHFRVERWRNEDLFVEVDKNRYELKTNETLKIRLVTMTKFIPEDLIIDNIQISHAYSVSNDTCHQKENLTNWLWLGEGIVWMSVVLWRFYRKRIAVNLK